MQPDVHEPEHVLNFWFPDNGHQNSAEAHAAFWTERMQGSMDAAIADRYGGLTLAAATGHLDHWAATSKGRLALLIALDQFPRSLWRDTPAAFAQDIKATRLALEGLENGHFDDLEPWEQCFYVIAIDHCEGPDHMDRMIRVDSVVEGIVTRIPGHMSQMGDRFRAQHARVKGVVERFGRHPHRNRILGRPSTLDEEEYVLKGDFPHLPRSDKRSGAKHG
jgi:uncharacterized protein (DUF924 family)